MNKFVRHFLLWIRVHNDANKRFAPSTWHKNQNTSFFSRWMAEQFLLDKTTNSVPNAYVLELYQQNGTRIAPGDGDWWVKPD